MPATKPTCPLARRQVLDRYFLEHRAKLLDIAAFLDRLDRAQPDPASADVRPDPHTPPADPRITALHDAIGILTDGQPHRARRILESLSDPTTEPVPVAPGKAAIGAPTSHAAPPDPQA